MDSECPLCSEDQPNVVFSDRTVIVRLSEEFACVGHTVISAVRHVENVSDLTKEETKSFFSVYRKAERALIEVFEADRVLAVKLGLAVPHLHIHLYPVRSDVTRAEVDRILARASREEPTDEEIRNQMRRLSELMV